MEFSLKFCTIVLLTCILNACGGATPIKQAQTYCLENDRDSYSDCLRHRAGYIEARKAMSKRFRDQRKSCDAYALQATGGTKNTCFNSGNTVNASSGTASVSASASLDPNCDPQDRKQGNSQSTRGNIESTRATSRRPELARQCMKDLGWSRHNSAREELEALDREYGYER